ncbi:diguanylate cyclase [Weissella coleopterorum]|uniref:Diguanylate cyclase n=1 Tax=Weissella coleopterorum TaxID=2714949 RepID=A0A6G8AZJ7_9LACO|nr:sensor domain-containing diguanylate cyclase [Weissella coleopterorum]QIL50389.1 diguanylate cyclase [Weissella coleopterorum]
MLNLLYNSTDIFSFMLMTLLISCFFTTGYVGYFNRLWNEIFIQNNDGTFLWKRVQIFLFGCGIGLYIHLATMLYFSGQIAMVFHNIALFLLVLPFLYLGGYNRMERLLQLMAAGYVWIGHHMGAMTVGVNMDQPPVIMALLITVILLVISQIPVVHDKILYHWQYSIVYFSLIAILFWGTLPAVSMGITMDLTTAIEAIIIFVTMNMVVMYLWFNGFKNTTPGQFEKSADYDALTKVHSFSFFQSESEKLFQTARNNNQPLGIIEWDIDRFKQVNDTFGHSAGNKILIEASGIVQKTLNEEMPTAKLFRTGGEEFTIMFPNNSIDDVLPTIKKAWDNVRKNNFFYEDTPIEVTISMGGTNLEENDTKFKTFYDRVDEYLYMSKRNGRNQITIDGEKIYSGEHRQQVVAMYAYFTQSLMQFTQRRFKQVSAELLLRSFDYSTGEWKIPEDININIETQLMLVQRLIDSKHLNRISINLELEQFSNSHVIDALLAFMEQQQELEQLNVEVSDIDKIKNWDFFAPTVQKLNDAHIRVVFNDINMIELTSELKQHLVVMNGIKLNLRSKAVEQADTIQMMKPWLKFCQDKNIRFTIDGIENNEDIQMARSFGVTYIQGFYFGIPELPVLS